MDELVVNVISGRQLTEGLSGYGYLCNPEDGIGMNPLSQDLAEVYGPVCREAGCGLFLGAGVDLNRHEPHASQLRELAQFSGFDGFVFTTGNLGERFSFDKLGRPISWHIRIWCPGTEAYSPWRPFRYSSRTFRAKRLRSSLASAILGWASRQAFWARGLTSSSNTCAALARASGLSRISCATRITSRRRKLISGYVQYRGFPGFRHWGLRARVLPRRIHFRRPYEAKLRWAIRRAPSQRAKTRRKQQVLTQIKPR